METLKKAPDELHPCETMHTLSSNVPLTGRRKSSLRLELLDPEEDEDLLNDGTRSARRPSTCSLSRYRSCPQLIPPQEEVSPMCEIILDCDINVRVSSANHDASSSVAGRRLLRDENGELRSGTPTPPSTPGSKRSQPSSFRDTSRASPGSTPLFSRRGGSGRKDYPSFHRTSSSGESTGQDGQSYSGVSLQTPLRDENNLLKFEDFNERNIKCFSRQPPVINDADRFSDPGDDYSRISNNQHYHHPTDEESHDKCERWLQGLKITRADRLKSRSHIELPPL
ncbi:uncharacterized protein LOC121383441 [Gigantopelta aegis]|uniref:uncharacterized protein LOC121383441 n=1 Tax=Gigantopelta aegis TaxID=1735272 RepID=UPI001B88B72A|nr:uncharacterized protein LOC121383441 [Gigantopelta aegis]XP_041369411.1 uncharacterized protein LOC121383441 [Gigantopelta aegis]